ncbi:MAG: protein kinase [Gemmataceae bacterium]|nr:protein kinase [Gemmataceae bacterium]
MIDHSAANLGRTVILPPPANTTEYPSQKFIDRLLAGNIVLAEDWEAIPERVQKRILESKEESRAIEQLVKHGLLTKYQAGRIEASTYFGLVLGPYRMLERLGAGGMAVVFKAEHIDLRHHVAVKVLPAAPKSENRGLESRFFAEMRIVARLRHPNIVAATDAGKALAEDGKSILRYLVMEYVPGTDLEEVVRRQGAMTQARACAIAYQIASALGETHKYGLVHRDVKPSNIMLTAEDQAKLLDFGLTRHFGHRMTVPGTILGTIDFMAPEQARDATTVDIRADIYGLGGTLYWCLTGKLPFPYPGSPIEALSRRINAPAPLLRQALPEASAELEAVVAKMMALKPEDRYSDPAAVMQALLPFVRSDRPSPSLILPNSSVEIMPMRFGESLDCKPHRILIIDDENAVRDLCKQLLEAEGAIVDMAPNGSAGLSMAQGDKYDLILLDVAMPDMNGVEVLARLRQDHKDTNLKVIMFSGHTTPEEMAEMLARGADDFLTKPFSVAQLLARVQNMLRLKKAQDKASALNAHLKSMNLQLEQSLKSYSGNSSNARNALISAIARLIDQRDQRLPGHLIRMQKYTKVLAEYAANRNEFSDQLEPDQIELISICAPLHDIGKVGVPDHVLMKVGTLTPEERMIMESHTTVGSEALKEIIAQHSPSLDFLQTAVEITRHHHEKFDGSGYPDRLAGEAIPVSAKIVAICDVYDALRSRRPYKPALAHNAAVQIIVQNSPGQFDPILLEEFQKVSGEFEKIFRDHAD